VLLCAAALAGARPTPVDPNAGRPTTAPAGATDAGQLRGVAWINIVQVFDKYQRAEELTERFRELHAKLKKEDERRLEAIKALRELLDKAESGSAEARRLQDEIQQRLNALRAWEKTQTQRLRRAHRDATVEMYGEIVAAAGRVARRRGYALVLNRIGLGAFPEAREELAWRLQERAVIWADDAHDLTDAVLAEANRAYRKRKASDEPDANADEKPPADPM
jgi:Skp family chaperone for outer membrane proteins